MTLRFTRMTVFVLALSVCALTVPHARAKAADMPWSVGPEMSATLDQLKELLIEGELEAALAKAHAASSEPDLTAYETYVIQSLITSVLVNLQNYGAAATALDTALSTEQVPEKDVPNQVKTIAALHYNASEYHKSIEASERFFNTVDDQKDVQILVIIAQIHFILKDYGAIVESIQNAINEADASGKDVDKRRILLWIASEYETGNDKGATVALKEFATRFPDANYHLVNGDCPPSCGIALWWNCSGRHTRCTLPSNPRWSASRLWRRGYGPVLNRGFVSGTFRTSFPFSIYKDVLLRTPGPPADSA